MTEPPIRTSDTSTTPEDMFTELFTQVFGPEKAIHLFPQYPFEDIHGGSRLVDFALRTLDQNVAFEIDGLTWHVPDPERIGKYEDDLLRQNSLVHRGWLVFRWTDRQIAQEPERVKEQLALFLERIPGLLEFEDFLPKQRGEVLVLRGHQMQALAALRQMRADRKTIALLTHAQGAGKTVTAITDAREVGGRTLFVVHTKELAGQAFTKFAELWPDVDVGLCVGQKRDTEAYNVVATVQSLSKRFSDFRPNDFAYLVIDEAHHATSESYQRVLRFFRPRFTLGLTATPDRADGQSALEVFQTAAHRLSLREAVECGELVPIRCVRVRTNVDLSRVRFNQVQYNRRDIEETVIVPGRDRLIVDTYRDHVPGRKAVAFCVNVRHGEELARRFSDQGFPARCVSGRMPTRAREEVFELFAAGKLRVLCACDLLNEGWDCPDVEVLLMARPTLSRVIYLQQLGRGTRKAPGKECLIVFELRQARSGLHPHRSPPAAPVDRFGPRVDPDHVRPCHPTILPQSRQRLIVRSATQGPRVWRSRMRLPTQPPDAFPVSPGHTLIIIRRHVREPFDLADEELLSAFQLVRSVRTRLDTEFQPDGYNLGFNVGEAAGQTVAHVHFHVIPRYRNDVANPTGGIRNVLPGQGPY